MYTDFSGYEHLVEKELNHRSISVAECREWIANKKCEYGSLGKGKEGIYSTNNKVNEDYPNRFTSFFTSKRYYKENCVIIETKVYSHFNQSRPSNVLADMSECKYQDGSCQPGKMNEIMIWDVNKDQNCQYISIGKLDGTMNNGLWINSQNQIALDLKGNKIIRDCNIDLLISEEGFAVKEIQNIQKLPTPQALTTAGLPSLQEMSIKSEIPRSEGLMNPQKYQKEREEYYKRQQEIQNQKDKETRDKYEADRKEFEKRREEKMKQYLEFEKRKKEKLERQRLLNTGPNTTTTSVNSNRSTNQSLEEPFPLPTYEEYSKIKNDCLLLPSFKDYLHSKDLEIKDFEKQKEACNTFPSYDEYVTKFAEYALKEFENRKSQRTKRQVYSDFQAAGEFQYLENKSNNLLRHTTEVMCDIFNEHSSLLETLIKENPRRYIQNQLNHSAIRVQLVSEDVVEVTFCKSLGDEEIDFIDLTHFGIEGSLALTQGQIPIKIRSLGDKIWYYSQGIISSSLGAHKLPRSEEIVNLKSFNDFDLNFLDDKVIFHEHILMDTKTNIEEELINEMQRHSDTSIQLHSNSQDGMIPHEILDEVESIFKKYYIRIWRIYVTIGVTLFYIFIGRSIWMVLSPKTFFNSSDRREGQGFFNSFSRQKNKRNPIFVRTKNHEDVELQEMSRSRRSLVVD